MDLNEAAVFVKVVQSGSFSAAARLLGLPTSTVSTRVARLEKRLGVTLLQRTTRRLNMTDAGMIYFEHASTGLGHMLEAEAAVTSTTGEAKGLLHVTAPADIGDTILTRIVNRVRQVHPKVRMDLALTDRYMDLVAEGIDVAIRAGVLQDSSLIAKQVGVACWALFASPNYLTATKSLTKPQQLRQHHCLQFTPLGKEQWTLSKAKDSLTVSMAGNVLVNDIRVILSMALSGQGVALLPTYLCRAECEKGLLVRVLPDWQAKTDPLNIVYPKQRFIPLKLRGFIDIATEEFHNWLDG